MKKHLINAARMVSLLPFLYFGTALFLGIYPVNRDFNPAQQGIDIYLRANAVHTDLFLPTHSSQRDWGTRLGGLEHVDYVAIGWGDRAFYLETRNWSDLRAGNALGALLGLDGSVLHVAAENRPHESDDTVRITISEAQFAAILTRIDATFELDKTGKPILIPGMQYAGNDKFYEAKGRYSMFATCNEWVRTILSQSGIRTSAWAPLAPALLYQAKQIEKLPIQPATP